MLIHNKSPYCWKIKFVFLRHTHTTAHPFKLNPPLKGKKFQFCSCWTLWIPAYYPVSLYVMNSPSVRLQQIYSGVPLPEWSRSGLLCRSRDSSFDCLRVGSKVWDDAAESSCPAIRRCLPYCCKYTDRPEKTHTHTLLWLLKWPQMTQTWYWVSGFLYFRHFEDEFMKTRGQSFNQRCLWCI